MQIVIDIPEEDFGWDGKLNICRCSFERLIQIVSDGTPLPKRYCRDCRWWKDSDGAYRRGVGAESQCPINCREVYDGNGYCFLFAPQESEGE